SPAGPGSCGSGSAAASRPGRPPPGTRREPARFASVRPSRGRNPGRATHRYGRRNTGVDRMPTGAGTLALFAVVVALRWRSLWAEVRHRRALWLLLVVFAADVGLAPSHTPWPVLVVLLVTPGRYRGTSMFPTFRTRGFGFELPSTLFPI